MGLFDGVPVLGTLEDAAGAGVDAVAGAASDVVEAADEAIAFAEDFVTDPVGAVEGALSDVSFSDLVDTVGLGLDDLAGKVLADAGLAPLVEGVSAIVEQIDAVVAAVLQGLKCLHWLDVPAFWAVVGGIYGARAAGIVSTQAECEVWAKRGELARLVSGTQVPLLSMLPCAIEAAFLAPMPSGGSPSLGGDVKARTTERLRSGRLAAAAEIVGAEGLLSVAMTPPPDVTCVSRSPGKLDVVLVRADGVPVSAAWEVGRDVAWRGWWPVAGGRAHPGTPVTAVSRSADKLDVFMVGLDGRVWTAAWEPGDTAWRGWWPIGDLRAAPGSVVGAVSRSTDKIDLFVVDAGGVAHTAAWEAGLDVAWRGWWPVAGGRAHPGTPVTAVSRSADKLDVFMVGLDGRVWTAAWEPGDTAWRGWWPIGDLRAAPGSVVGAVSRSTDKIDLFVVDAGGVAHTAAWEVGLDVAWRGWWPVAGGRAHPGTPVTAVSRSADKLDVFMVGLDGRVWTAAWEPGDTAWRGWWPIGDLKVPARAAVHAVSRGPGLLDIVARGYGGAAFTAAWEAGRDVAWRGWWWLH